MSRKHYDKLVRDKTAQIIVDKGNKPAIQTLSTTDRQVQELFKKKLQEEVGEYLEADGRDEQLEEAADIVQVLKEHLSTRGYSFEDLEQVMRTKIIKRGKFITYEGMGNETVSFLKYVDNRDKSDKLQL